MWRGQETEGRARCPARGAGAEAAWSPGASGRVSYYMPTCVRVPGSEGRESGCAGRGGARGPRAETPRARRPGAAHWPGAGSAQGRRRPRRGASPGFPSPAAGARRGPRARGRRLTLASGESPRRLPLGAGTRRRERPASRRGVPEPRAGGGRFGPSPPHRPRPRRAPASRPRPRPGARRPRRPGSGQPAPAELRELPRAPAAASAGAAPAAPCVTWPSRSGSEPCSSGSLCK